MWFTSSSNATEFKINSIEWNVISKFVGKGYQETTIDFSVDITGDSNASLVIPVPWAPNKPSGGISILETNCESIQTFDLLKKLRDLNLNVMFIEDLKYSYINDDFDCGYLFLPQVVSGKKYTLTLKFKISPNCCLYVPLMMANNLFQTKTPVDCSVTVSGIDRLRGYNKKLLLETSPTTYKFLNSPTCNEDAFFHINDWDSSSDEE